MDGAETGVSDGVCAHHARLQLGNFRKSRIDRIFDHADLSGDFVRRTFDNLFAHDCSFPGAPHAGVAVGLV
jgi:hypothetical protein